MIGKTFDENVVFLISLGVPDQAASELVRWIDENRRAPSASRHGSYGVCPCCFRA